MGYDKEDEIIDEEELDQDGIDDFDFLASSEINKSPHRAASEDSEDKSSGENESSSKKIKKENRGKDEEEEEELDKNRDHKNTENKRKRSPSKEEVTEKKKSKTSPEGRKEKESREKSKQRDKERDRSKERDRGHKRRSENWDHYEPSKDRRKDSKSPERKQRSSSLERRKSPKRNSESPETEKGENADLSNSPKTNGTTPNEDSEYTPKREEKPEIKREEPYTPSNKYTQRKTSQFGQRLSRTNQEVKQPQIIPDQLVQQNQVTEEQPRYRNYASSVRKPGDQEKKQQPQQNDRLFSPLVYTSMELQEYGSHNPMGQTSSRALPLTQVGTPPPPGGVLLPGLPLSLHTITNINHHYNNSYQHKKQENSQNVREIPIPRTEDTKIPEDLKISEERRVNFKKEASKVVVKHLSKYLKKGRITNKDDFKHLSRKLAHKVMKKEEGSGFLMTQKTPKKIKKYVDFFFKKHPGIYVKEQREWEKPLALQAFESKT